jgi:trans-aconitate methyltransferase
LRVYPHELSDIRAVVDWLQGTTLRPYRDALDVDRYRAFLDELAARLLDHYGDVSPFLYTFKRILFHATF